jgi:hypothetical protein
MSASPAPLTGPEIAGDLHALVEAWKTRQHGRTLSPVDVDGLIAEVNQFLLVARQASQAWFDAVSLRARMVSLVSPEVGRK